MTAPVPSEPLNVRVGGRLCMLPRCVALRRKYQRTRANVRNVQRVLAARKYEAASRRLSDATRVLEEIGWKVGGLLHQTEHFTWIRFDTREEFLEYLEFKKTRPTVAKFGGPDAAR